MLDQSTFVFLSFFFLFFFFFLNNIGKAVWVEVSWFPGSAGTFVVLGNVFKKCDKLHLLLFLK